MNGYLYVGQGVPAEQAFGAAVYDLFSHQRISFFDRDPKAWRSWGAYDSSPVVAGGFVFRPGENGTIYKLGADGVSVHSLLRYRTKNRGAAGVEASMAVFSNYGFISDNHGNILCINLDRMHPVWHFDNCDDTDATPVLDVEQGRPILYVGSAVDKQGKEGYSHLTKIDALTGEFIWQHPIPCQKIDYAGKLREGGMFSTPLLGRGDCEGVIFANFCGLDSSTAGALVAIDRQSGKILYRTPLHYYSWSSPVAFTDAEGRMYIVTGDVIGYIYLIEAKSGRIIYSKRVAANFESSPVVVDDCVVVGSRGNMIYKFQVK
jgi:outer membrane protein assembly factor BamB